MGKMETSVTPSMQRGSGGLVQSAAWVHSSSASSPVFGRTLSFPPIVDCLFNTEAEMGEVGRQVRAGRLRPRVM